jgi:DNA-binding GntR family transcriptional regulator
MDQHVPGSSLTHTAYEQLRTDLLAGRLQPGEKLKISDLCASLSVGLSAVREALSRLTSEGLVVAAPQRGFRVAPVSAKDLLDLTEARVEIEGLCLRQSIGNANLAWETGIVAAFHRLSRTPERVPEDPVRINEAWASAHAAYHQALVSACDNSWLLRVRDLLYAQSERYRRLSAPFSEEKRDTETEHRKIMDAVLARDADHAYELMASHFRLTTRLLLNGRLFKTLDHDMGAAEPKLKKRPAQRHPL